MQTFNSYAEKQIEEIKKECEKIKPLVVIHSLAYNHGPYIRDALEGFVKQRTDFPFVAIVHDDTPTDNTAEIIREYSEKYPKIFHTYEYSKFYSR